MVWWEGDNLTTPDYSYYSAGVNSGNFIFRDWTNYLPSTTDLFYANGTISFSQIKILKAWIINLIFYFKFNLFCKKA